MPAIDAGKPVFRRAPPDAQDGPGASALASCLTSVFAASSPYALSAVMVVKTSQESAFHSSKFASSDCVTVGRRFFVNMRVSSVSVNLDTNSCTNRST